MKAFKAVIKGYVQGVGFRYATLIAVAHIGHIVGYVRNLPNGAVEVVAEGPEPELEALLNWLHRGPSGAIVEEVSVVWTEPTGEFREFSIRR
ncbi:acylphosphatase [Coprothermobacteraceae bacterium]|nr:acylphosphatase [Coprothermobacteraceae bacterium]